MDGPICWGTNWKEEFTMKRKDFHKAIALVCFLAAAIQPAFAQDDPLLSDPPLLVEPTTPRIVEGTGTYFEVTDSEYLNITLDSTEALNLRLESTPEMVVMHLEAAQGAISTQITLYGFPASTTFYKYEDDYHNGVALTTDANGGCTYTQDLSEGHLVFIQPTPSTIFLNDTTGWSNPLVGTWDPITRTGTLTQNVTETIQIDSNNITLDGDRYTVAGTGTGFGVYLRGRTGVTVKNLNLTNFGSGIYLALSSSNTLTGNTASNNSFGIYIVSSSGNTLTGNTTNSNSVGIRLDSSSGNTLAGNTASNNYQGINVGPSGGNTLTGNTVNLNYYTGMLFNGSSDNEVYNNSFVTNGVQARVSGGSGNIFNLDKPIGGNFWSDWTTPDVNPQDGFVDYPYVFYGGQDNLPWAIPDGWANKPPVADAGINFEILTVEQVWTVVRGSASDQDGDPLQYRWVEGGTVLLDWADVGASGEAYLGLGTVPCFSVGDHTLTLEVREVREGGLTASDEVILTIENSPPEVQPSPIYQTVQIWMDRIVVVADVSDFDGDTLTYKWLKDSEVLALGSVEAPVGGGSVLLPNLEIGAGDPRFPLGVHSMELCVSDGVNAPVSKFVSVEVIDTMAPSLSPVPNVAILWPPDHKMRYVTIWANAFDNGGGAIQLSVTVASSEPSDADADGNTIPDYYIDLVDDEAGVIELQLRSERAGTGDGRTYRITITATDGSGNQSVATVEVLAPHDKGKK
jgi:parallel beta-helix repeat protein